MTTAPPFPEELWKISSVEDVTPALLESGKAHLDALLLHAPQRLKAVGYGNVFQAVRRVSSDYTREQLNPLFLIEEAILQGLVKENLTPEEKAEIMRFRKDCQQAVKQWRAGLGTPPTPPTR